MKASAEDTLRVRLHARWADDENVRNVYGAYGPAPEYRWRNLELTLGDDYDVLVVLDHPRIRGYDPSRTIVFESEPAPSRARYEQYFEHPPEAFRAFYDIERHHSLNIWHVGRPDVEATPEKTRLFSAVISTTRSLPRHAERLEFVSRYLPKLPEFDHFGRGEFTSGSYRGPIASKAAGLLPYRYTFNAENWSEPNYFTEKIVDAILCETLCFYDGCPNLELFLDPDTFIRVDMSTPDGAIAQIEEAIARDEWSRRIKAIRAQKHRILNELNPLEIVRKVVSGEPIVWRPDRPPISSLDSAALYRVDPHDLAAQRAALGRIAMSRDRLGLVIDSRAQLTDTAAATVKALVSLARPGDFVLLGGTGMQLFRHVGTRSLAGACELRYVVPTGEQRPVAYAATPEAARTILRTQDLRSRGGALPAVWPPIAYVPGPVMRGEPHEPDTPLLRASGLSVLHRVGDEIAAALPRGKRLAAVTTEAVSLAGATLRRLGARAPWPSRRRPSASRRSSSYPHAP